MNITDEQVIRFYNSGDWKRTRKQKLANNPLCETCKLVDRIIVSTHVHHSLPIRKFWEQRFNQEFLFSLCDACHCAITDQIKREEER